MKMLFSKNKKSVQGISALILFIAVILVAAVAAGVLIQTSSSLQSKSLSVGKETQKRVTTDLEIIQIKADDASDGIINSNDTITTKIRLSAGSEVIKLEDLVITLDGATGSQSLTSGSSASVTEFASTYLTNGGTAIRSGYLASGEIIEISFKSGLTLKEADTFVYGLASQNGVAKSLNIRIPDVLVNKREILFP